MLCGGDVVTVSMARWIVGIASLVWLAVPARAVDIDTGQLLYGTEGNRLRRYDLDTIDAVVCDRPYRDMFRNCHDIREYGALVAALFPPPPRLTRPPRA